MENQTEKASTTTSAVEERDLIVLMRKLDLVKELGFVVFFLNHYESTYRWLFLKEKNKLNYNVFNLI